jgi:hypothetical protein
MLYIRVSAGESNPACTSSVTAITRLAGVGAATTSALRVRRAGFQDQFEWNGEGGRGKIVNGLIPL